MARAPRSQAPTDDFSDIETEDEASVGSITDDEIVTRISKEDDRHGKFVNLTNFMNITAEGARTLSHELPGILQAQPGWIIHIKDNEDKAIDGRVLLVLQVLTQSIMCLSFCLHTPIRLYDHWRVYKVGDAPRNGQHIASNTLEVHLRPFTSLNESFTPNLDITLNLRDIWNIETSVSRTVRAAYMGRVKTDSLQRLSVEVQRTFCRYQNEAIPQPRRQKGKHGVRVNETHKKKRKHTVHG